MFGLFLFKVVEKSKVLLLSYNTAEMRSLFARSKTNDRPGAQPIARSALPALAACLSSGGLHRSVSDLFSCFLLCPTELFL